MKLSVKKTVIVGMIGVMQLTYAGPVLAASLLQTSDRQEVTYSRHDRNDHWNKKEKRRYEERKREHDRRMREEKRRHDYEMKRRHNESRWEWERRRERERDRHERALRNIAALLIGVAIGSRL